ncbi:hypothetical protein KY290_031068 [Solanum tuberosum]|uniref:Uncharacterized protein n=1 Tax=Solanum tuberosum TaxID=4113 RepID=A0ABQ7UBK3_SOLTU|nr:hypothetical protein KY290_031068 [Solanum tuberosum]
MSYSIGFEYPCIDDVFIDFTSHLIRKVIFSANHHHPEHCAIYSGQHFLPIESAMVARAIAMDVTWNLNNTTDGLRLLEDSIVMGKEDTSRQNKKGKGKQYVQAGTLTSMAYKRVVSLRTKENVQPIVPRNFSTLVAQTLQEKV